MEGHAGTENLELPEAGTVTGVVTDQNNNPVAGASVDVCANEACYQTQTDGFCAYSIGEVSDGEYVTTVAPSYTYDSATSPKFNVTGMATSTVNLTVSAPVAPPAGTEMPGSQTIDLGNSVQVPLFFWQAKAPLRTIACVGGQVTATVTGTNTHTQEVQTIGPVLLAELAPTGSGKFEGELPRLYPIHGPLTIKIKVEGCQHPSEDEEKNSTPTWTRAASSWTAIMPMPRYQEQRSRCWPARRASAR